MSAVTKQWCADVSQFVYNSRPASHPSWLAYADQSFSWLPRCLWIIPPAPTFSAR